jgi:hypothetical protein
MRLPALISLLVCATPAPGSSGAPPTSPTPAIPANATAVAGALELSVDVVRRGGGSIVPDQILSTNESFEIRISTNKRAHVYLGGVNAAHEAYLLFPSGADSALLEAGEHRLPPRPKSWLYLAPPAGQETLFVIASPRSLADVDKTIAATVGEVDLGEAKDSAPTGNPAKAAGAASAAAPARREGNRKPPRLRDDRARPQDAPWAPDPARIAALHPRGAMLSRIIKVRDEGPVTLVEQDGLIVYLLRFSHTEPKTGK